MSRNIGMSRHPSELITLLTWFVLGYAGRRIRILTTVVEDGTAPCAVSTLKQLLYDLSRATGRPKPELTPSSLSIAVPPIPDAASSLTRATSMDGLRPLYAYQAL